MAASAACCRGLVRSVRLSGRSHEAAGNRRPREMVALDRTRLTGPLRVCASRVRDDDNRDVNLAVFSRCRRTRA